MYHARLENTRKPTLYTIYSSLGRSIELIKHIKWGQNFNRLFLETQKCAYIALLQSLSDCVFMGMKFIKHRDLTDAKHTSVEYLKLTNRNIYLYPIC